MEGWLGARGAATSAISNCAESPSRESNRGAGLVDRWEINRHFARRDASRAIVAAPRMTCSGFPCARARETKPPECGPSECSKQKVGAPRPCRILSHQLLAIMRIRPGRLRIRCRRRIEPREECCPVLSVVARTAAITNPPEPDPHAGTRARGGAALATRRRHPSIKLAGSGSFAGIGAVSVRNRALDTENGNAPRIHRHARPKFGTPQSAPPGPHRLGQTRPPTLQRGPTLL